MFAPFHYSIQWHKFAFVATVVDIMFVHVRESNLMRLSKPRRKKNNWRINKNDKRKYRLIAEIHRKIVRNITVIFLEIIITFVRNVAITNILISPDY